MAARRLIPLFDRVLVERILPEAKTKGGILLPEAAKPALNEGVVVAVGEGMRTESGVIAPAVKEGDKVLLPEFGGTTLKLEDKEYSLYRDSDLLGVFN
eukprot:m.9933 g.9933  ORF g.9933 m.9933 type:complete len:98 (+) comp9535_c0_seq1:117-410(+)